MTRLVDPKLKQHIPVADVVSENLLSKQQVQELLSTDQTLIASVMKISGYHKTVFAWVGNTLFGWGDSNAGHRIFGLADEIISQPTRISNFEALDADIADIVCGKNHAFVLLSNGELWGSGEDTNGELGTAAVSDTSTNWIKIEGPWTADGGEVIKVFTTPSTSFVIAKSYPNAGADVSYQVYGTGKNLFYQTGAGPNSDVPTWDPTYQIVYTSIGADPNYTADDFEFAGNYDSTMLWIKNPVFVFGEALLVTGVNSNGQLGLGNTTSPQAFWQNYSFNEIPGYPGVKPVKLLMGDRSAGCLGDDGYLYFCGHNANDVWGIGNTSNQSSWIQIPAYNDVKDFAVCDWETNPGGNENAVIAVLNDGTLKVSGYNGFGAIPLQGTGYFAPPQIVPDERVQGTRFMAVWAVGFTRFALDTVGNLWGWGYNSDMQVGQGFDYSYDDDTIRTPQTISDINNARLSLTFQNLIRNYTHPTIPQIVEQTIIQGGGGDYTYRAITGHATETLGNGINGSQGSTASYTYTLSGFQGIDLDASNIRKLHVEVDINAQAAGTGDNTEVLVTFPDGSTRPLASADSDGWVYGNPLKMVAEIPIASGQVSVTFTVNIIGGSTESWAYFTIFACEEYVSQGNSGRSWTVDEKQAQGVNGTILTAGDWRTIPFNTTLGVNNILGSALNANEFTLPPGRYSGHLHFNPAGGNALPYQWGSTRIYDVTNGQELQRLPNVDYSFVVDYFGLGHRSGNSLDIPFEIDVAVEKVIRFECYPNQDLTTGVANNKVSIGDEYYSRVQFKGYEIERSISVWDYDSGWLSINTPTTGHDFTHSLGVDVFTSMVVQFRDANNIPLQIMGSMFGSDRAPGEYNDSYGPRCYMPDTNNVRVDVGSDSALHWLPNRPSPPVGWSTNQPTEIRLLLKM